MKCPKCRFDNPDDMKFCGRCGHKIQSLCPHCHFDNPPTFKFCGHCGGDLSTASEPPHTSAPRLDAPHLVKDTRGADARFGTGSERKYVTVMFSDLTGYTEMSERLDPEEVKEITSGIFSNIARIIEKYDGFIEKYIGDAILAVFGAVEAFEDSPLRAIKAAREIHAHIKSVSPRYENLIGRPLSMHTGINTGLVVTGEINFPMGTHGLVGDTINTAARLMGVSQAGEIVVDHHSFLQTEGYFEFEPLEPVKVKGKAERIPVLRVGQALPVPQKLHRLHGRRAELIGRSAEMQVLQDAADRLAAGQGTIVAICGAAGSGKSRLAHDFKRSLDFGTIQWFDASAYPYTQNTPYFPLIDLLTKAFDIKEDDNPDAIKRKVESGIANLLGSGSRTIPFVGGLFAAEYAETSGVSPEYWKEQLFAAVEEILMALASAKPTVICIEDMHWADASFMELARKLMRTFSGPILMICIYRPIITLLTQFETGAVHMDYQELRLQELSPSETQSMVASLLKSDRVPKALREFIRDNVEGNPFYVEELINALIESEALSNTSGGWELGKPFDQAGVTTNVQGVIGGRIDRLAEETKRILQEASVIGRAFLLDILKRVSRIKVDLERNLVLLERLDLIRARSFYPSLEYIFKHALTQEIVYNGLVKSERRSIHERIGFVIEQIFQDRLSEFYEILAFHFSAGENVPQAIEYLTKSGEKCLKRYAVDESDRYYGKAYDVLLKKQANSDESRELLFAILNNWSLVWYYRGDFKKPTEILKQHEAEADLLVNQESRGMYFGWLGLFLHFRGAFDESYEYLQKALRVGEAASNPKVIGYACTWLTWLCAVSDKYDEGYSYWRRAVTIAKQIPTDAYLYQKSLGGLCQLASFSGKKQDCHDIGIELIQFGQERSNIRSQVVGHMCIGHGLYVDGDLTNAISAYRKAIAVARDPFYTQWPKLYLGICCVLTGRFDEGADVLADLSAYIEAYGCEVFNGAALTVRGLALIGKGEMSQGLDLIQEGKAYCRTNDSIWGIAMAELVLGNLYYQLAYGERSGDVSILINNLGFLAKNIPFASRKSESHFVEAIEFARRCDGRGLLGQAHLGLGLLYRAKKMEADAKKHLSEAANIFKAIESDINHHTAIEALEKGQ
jgi:class 3 adenylate cyclase/tetratricopeptide (TPR) repeat protein